ncbi:hypothetical protein AHAS_Ahas19G0091200 [Arachis hypogaea]
MFISSLTDFLSISGDWDIEWINEWLPDDIVKKINALAPPSPWKEKDQIAWTLTSDGSFKLQSAYQDIQDTTSQPNNIFSLVWKWKGPERIRMFLWLVAHDAILTNAARKRRHMTSDNRCPRCSSNEESTLHVLHDCFFAKSIWCNLLPSGQPPSFFGFDLSNWLLSNISKETKWSNLFGYATSHLLIPSTLALINIKARYEEYLRVMENQWKTKQTNPAHNNLIRWFPPAEDVIKLNVDGSFYENQNNAACGGVFRDHLGCSIMQAKIWGVVHGLQIAVAKNFHQIIVETDSTSVLELVKSGCATRHTCASLLADINIQAQRLTISE